MVPTGMFQVMRTHTLRTWSGAGTSAWEARGTVCRKVTAVCPGVSRFGPVPTVLISHLLGLTVPLKWFF